MKLTEENWDEMLADREFRDFLNSQPHPVMEMDDSGYTYLDYVLFKAKKYNRPVKHIIAEVNLVLEEKGRIYQWSNGRRWEGDIN